MYGLACRHQTPTDDLTGLYFYSTVPLRSSHKTTSCIVKSFSMQIVGTPYGISLKCSFLIYMYIETHIQNFVGKQ
jgi:hypothetical protein